MIKLTATVAALCVAIVTQGVLAENSCISTAVPGVVYDNADAGVAFNLRAIEEDLYVDGFELEVHKRSREAPRGTQAKVYFTKEAPVTPSLLRNESKWHVEEVVRTNRTIPRGSMMTIPLATSYRIPKGEMRGVIIIQDIYPITWLFTVDNDSHDRPPLSDGRFEISGAYSISNLWKTYAHPIPGFPGAVCYTDRCGKESRNIVQRISQLVDSADAEVFDINAKAEAEVADINAKAEAEVASIRAKVREEIKTIQSKTQ